MHLLKLEDDVVGPVRDAINVDRVVQTAVRLIAAPSPTCNAGPAADVLADILNEQGFDVQRQQAGWPDSPAVVVRWRSGRPGRTIQFNGHLDTVHLPFVAPRVNDGYLYGSGATDMKGGVAAMCEALLVLRQTDALPGGNVLLTAHDLHEAPWGDGRQLKTMVDEGYVGDGVLVPEYLADRMPLMGRGMAIVEVDVTRDGPPMHEVQGGMDQPSVIAAGAQLVLRLGELDQQLSVQQHPLGDRESLFIGQVAAGEIFNQSPPHFRLAGTRRWLPGTQVGEVESRFHALLAQVEQACAGICVQGKFNHLRDAFELDRDDPLVAAFDSACTSTMGRPLPPGGKPFLDDANTIMEQTTDVSAITHGPNGTGAHTTQEQVPVAELARVAQVYALTAVAFCGDQHG